MTTIATTTPAVPSKWTIPSPAKFLDLYKKYGDVVYCKVPTFNMYLCSDEDAIPKILNSNDRDADIIREAPPKGSFRERISGNSILVNSGNEWRSQRHALQPLFSATGVVDLLPIMQKAANDIAARWENNTRPLDMGQEFTELPLQVITDALFIGINDDEKVLVAKHITRLMDAISFTQPLNPVTRYRFTQSLKWLNTFIQTNTKKLPENSIIRQLETTYEGTPEGLPLFMRQQVLSLFLAAVETTSSTMTWMFYHLASDRELLKQVQMEMSEFELGSSFTLNQLRSTKMTSSLIHEILRFYAPAWLIPRKAIRQTMVSGYAIPEDANVVVSPYVIHRKKSLWGEDAELFSVERWQKQNPVTHKSAFIPFGAGQHTCIGNHFSMLELITAVKILTQRFTFNVYKAPKAKAAVTYQPVGFVATPIKR